MKCADCGVKLPLRQLTLGVQAKDLARQAEEGGDDVD